MRTTFLALGLLALLMGQTGCPSTTAGRTDGASSEPATLTSGRMPEKLTLAARMRAHDVHGAAMRDAVARADLDGARREAKLLADLRLVSGIDPGYRGQLDAMSVAAAHVAEAKDLTEMSRGVAAVARTCGDCHATLGGPKVIVNEATMDAPGVAPRMLRHQWAAARLWDGIVGPSQDAWRGGARVLQDAPLEPEVLTPGKSPVPAIGTLASSVHELGRKARVVESNVDRVAVYGELLATCSACHARLGGGPPEQRDR